MRERRQFEIDGGTEELAKVREFIQTLPCSFTESRRGIFHSDGEIRTCDPPPEGFRLMQSTHTQSYYAIPNNAAYTRDDMFWRRKLPPETQIWFSQTWSPIIFLYP